MQIKGLKLKAKGALPKRKVRPRSPDAPPSGAFPKAPPASVRKRKVLPRKKPKHIEPDVIQRPAHIMWQHHAKAAAKKIPPAVSSNMHPDAAQLSTSSSSPAISREQYMQDERLFI